MVMKTKLYTMLLLLICTIAVKGQEYQEFHVETPGTLREVIGKGAEDLTHIRVTGTINDQDIAFLCSLSRPRGTLYVSMNPELYLKMAEEKEDTQRTYKLQYLDLENACLMNDALPYEAFAYSHMKEYKLPKTLKKIGANAFACNVLLKELIIPESVEEIGRNMLYYSIKVEKVRLPDNLEVLNDLVMSECWALKEVNIPSKLREIHGVVFSNTKLPPSILVMPETLEVWDGTSFTGFPSVEEVVIPKNVRVLRDAFWMMEGLRKVTIRTQKLKEIGDNTFYCCGALEDVNLPEDITRVGQEAFYLNTSLRKINLPSTLTRIEYDAFRYDPLEVIDLPAGMTYIGTNAFSNNDELKKVYARPIIPPAADLGYAPKLPFYYSSTRTATLYVPKGSAEAYRSSDVFCEFGEIVELEEGEWPTAVGTPTLSPHSYNMYGENGKLYIEAVGNDYQEPVTVNVYAGGGTSVWQGTVTDNVEIQLPKGFYVVRAGQTTHKVSL